MSEPFWSDDLWMIFDPLRLPFFFPSKGMTLNQTLNSISRFCILTTIIFCICYGSMIYIVYGIISLVVILLLYQNQSIVENFKTLDFYQDADDGLIIAKPENTPCRMPTYDNPWMNKVPHSKDPNLKACKGYGVQDLSMHLARESLGDDFDSFEWNKGFYPFLTITGDGGNGLNPDFVKFANWSLDNQKMPQ